jgi:hypothetical protein
VFGNSGTGHVDRCVLGAGVVPGVAPTGHAACKAVGRCTRQAWQLNMHDHPMLHSASILVEALTQVWPSHQPSTCDVADAAQTPSRC